MKMTVVLDEKGELVAAQQGPIQDPGKPRGDGAMGGLVAGPGQRLEEMDVPDDLGRMEDAEAFAKGIRAHLAS